MDGTLLDDAKGIGSVTAAAIHHGAAKDVRFVLASARPFCSAYNYAATLGLDTPLICYNGALVKSPDAVQLRHPLSSGVARELAELCRAEGLYAKVYDDDMFYVAAATDETPKYSRVYHVSYRAVGDLPEFISSSDLAPLSFVIHADPARLPSLLADIEARFAGRVNCHCPNEHAIHISSPEASKLAAVRLLAERWGIRAGDVMAVGDGSNDLDVVNWAGVGVAVANAAPDLLAAADWVAPDNNSDGVGVALERYLGLSAGENAETAATAAVATPATGGRKIVTVPAQIVVESGVTIDAPPQRVWEIFAAIDRWPLWNPVCVAAGHVAGRRWTRGASIRMTLRKGPLHFTVRARLITAEPGRRVVWLGRVFGLQAIHTFTLEETGRGTRVTSNESFSGPLLPVARATGFPTRVGEMIDTWLDALKREAESA